MKQHHRSADASVASSDGSSGFDREEEPSLSRRIFWFSRHPNFSNMRSGYVTSKSSKIRGQWIDLAANHMPCLRDLQVDNCDSLPMLPHLDCLTSLEKLQISGCTMLTELPTLPASLKSLVIKDSAILAQRCQVGQPDWSKIIGIKVEIDSDPVDTSVLHPVAPDEAARHQSNGMQDQGTANGNQLTSPQLQSTVTKQMLCENDNIQGRSSVSCEKSSKKSSSGGFGLHCLGGCFRKME